MLIVIPILTILVVFLNLLGLQQVRPSRLTGCRVALLQTVLIAGVFVALQSEMLSLLHGLTRLYIGRVVVPGAAAFSLVRCSHEVDLARLDEIKNQPAYTGLV